MAIRFTDRQKLIISCVNPYYRGLSTREEVKQLRQRARGHYWHDAEMFEYFAMSPKGRREYFPYDWINGKPEGKQEALAQAKAWAGK